MNKRALLLTAVVAALAVPAVSLADDGGNGNGNGGGKPAATTAGARGLRVGWVVSRTSKRLDRRFQAFSKHCLVANAPDRCGKAADRLVRQLERQQTLLGKVVTAIQTRCAAASPPAWCSRAADATQKLGDLKSKLAADESAVKAAFPAAGSA